MCTGSQREAMVTPKAKTDIQKQGNKYGNLQIQNEFLAYPYMLNDGKKMVLKERKKER